MGLDPLDELEMGLQLSERLLFSGELQVLEEKNSVARRFPKALSIGLKSSALKPFISSSSAACNTAMVSFLGTLTFPVYMKSRMNLRCFILTSLMKMIG